MRQLQQRQGGREVPACKWLYHGYFGSWKLVTPTDPDGAFSTCNHPGTNDLGAASSGGEAAILQAVEPMVER